MSAGWPRIEQALQEALTEEPDFEQGDIVGDWIVIAHVPNVNRDSGTSYMRWYSNGSMHDHIARGLIHSALSEMDRDDEA